MKSDRPFFTEQPLEQMSVKELEALLFDGDKIVVETRDRMQRIHDVLLTVQAVEQRKLRSLRSVGFPASQNVKLGIAGMTLEELQEHQAAINEAIQARRDEKGDK